MPFKTIINGNEVSIPEELVDKYDRPAPRYTSYPTVPVWTGDIGPDDLICAFKSSKSGTLSLYFHIPFCEKRCLFCGCSTIATPKHDVAERYIDTVIGEISLYKSSGLDTKDVVQLHFGGGTPTFLTCDQLERLWNAVASSFNLDNDAEIGIEADPRITTTEQLELLRKCGFNRISFGLQDVSDIVQRAIGRIEPLEHIKKITDKARSLGFKSVNIDLVYGLPFQTAASFRYAVEAVIGLSPDRIACFNFAYLPQMLPHQRRIESGAMPAPEEKFSMFCRTIAQFSDAGYDFIGMDHFARYDDELSVAARSGTLWRNFQGYTTKSGTDLLGFGLTAISDVNGIYAQNEKKLAGYYRRIGSGIHAICRGWRLSDDDIRRRNIIRDIFCKGKADISGVLISQDALDDIKADGLVKISGKTLEVTPQGRLFIRNIAVVFDRYLGPSAEGFSRTV